MIEEHYQSLQAEYKDFVDTCCETYPIFRNWASFMTWADKIEQKISNLEAERDEWKQDAERLATILDNLFMGCILCNGKKKNSHFTHEPDCPITLHRELVAKYGGSNE